MREEHTMAAIFSLLIAIVAMGLITSVSPIQTEGAAVSSAGFITGSQPIPIMLLLVIVIVIAAVGFMFYKRKQQLALPAQPLDDAEISDLSTPSSASGPTLQQYIRKSQAAGFNEQTIRSQLLAVGWKKQDIDAAFTDLQ